MGLHRVELIAHFGAEKQADAIEQHRRRRGLRVRSLLLCRSVRCSPGCALTVELSQGQRGERLADVAHFGGALQEFAANGRVVEQMPHFDARARRAVPRPRLRDSSPPWQVI